MDNLIGRRYTISSESLPKESRIVIDESDYSVCLMADNGASWAIPKRDLLAIASGFIIWNT